MIKKLLLLTACFIFLTGIVSADEVSPAKSREVPRSPELVEGSLSRGACRGELVEGSLSRGACRPIRLCSGSTLSLSKGRGVGAAEDAATAGGPDGGDWIVINGSYAAIYAQNSVDLKSAVRKINVDFARYDPVEKNLFLDRSVSDMGKLSGEIDILVRKARKILDMYPSGFRINIKIYDNQEALNDVYREIFEEEADYKAFYVHKFHTIYISFSSLSESVLAHEIGHAIIDAYFTISLPPKIKELLACYVDMHLKD